jgi:hypothetical protein
MPDNQSTPPGLVARAKTFAGFAVEVLVEQHQIAPAWIIRPARVLAVARTSSIAVREPTTAGLGYTLGDYEGLVPALGFDIPAVALWIDRRSGDTDPYAIRINRTKGTTFETWRKLRFSTNDLVNLAISGETADPDGDGIPNRAEYAFGLEPNHADAGPLKIAQGGSGSGTSVTVSYERLAVLSDIQFSWESSANLLEWKPASPTQERVGPGRDPWLQRVEASFPDTDQMRLFRLAMARVPPGP